MAVEHARAFAYVRVSEAREGMISPEIQLDEISRFCSAKGWVVVEKFEDLDLSASTLPPEKRPALQDMLRRAEDGEADVVVFYAIDRLARRMEDHYAILASLREAGVAVDSVGQPWSDSPEGLFMWDLSAALAALEARRHGKRIRDSHRRLRSQGRWAGGIPPFGMRVREGGGLEPDPIQAPLVLEMIAWYQSGWSFGRISRELNARGLLSKEGRPWLQAKVRKAILSPYVAGGRLQGDELIVGDNISPLVDRETWERTRAIAQTRGRLPAGRTPRLALTGKLVKCGTCGSALLVHYDKKGEAAYRCPRKYQGACSRGVVIQARILEPLVVDELVGRLRGVRVAPPAPELPTETIGPIGRELDQVNDALGRLAVAYSLRELESSEYQTARRKLLERKALLQEHIERAARRIQDQVLLEALEALWDDLGRLGEDPGLIAAIPVESRRDLFETTIARVIVRPRDHPERISVEFRF